MMSLQNHSASLGAWAFRFRGGLWTLFFLGVFFSVQPDLASFLWGFPVVFLGQSLRFWAAGSIRRYRGEVVGAEELVTWGPFAWVRNPLYLGNGLIGLGWSLMAGNPYILPLYGIFFILLYPVIIIPHEESFLRKTFGEAYSSYYEKTPMLFPRRLLPRTLWKGPFQVGILWKSERHSLYVTLAGTFLFFLKTFLQ
jgi:protein-S-isoprenylcysteine O-methyltransferase Ste14